MSQLKLDEKIIYNIYDVHQIFYFNKKIYLTDTGKNRIQIYNCVTKEIESFINIGNDRKNLIHVNAIFVDKNKILIGLNNVNMENFRNAQIIKINTNKTYDSNICIDAYDKGKIIESNDIYHTHDLENIDNDFFVSASEDGNLLSLNKLTTVKSLPKWDRGISKSNNHIYVGKSALASRKLRHSKYYDGKISVLKKDSFEIIDELLIPKIGQLNDILYYEG